MSTLENIALGIDIGGSSVKGGLVNLELGELSSKKVKIPTPIKSSPQNIIKVIKEIINDLNIDKNIPVGVTVPAPVKNDVIESMANLDSSWANINLKKMIKEEIGIDAAILNDADAAACAELQYGRACGEKGLIFLSTLGTGIGTSLIHNGAVIVNTEFGHMDINGIEGEKIAAGSIKTKEKLNWDEWVERLQIYYSAIEKLFSPDLILIGGAISKEHRKFIPKLNLKTKVCPMKLKDNAEIIGIGYYSSKYNKK
ncbi:MAG: ROK family protein [Methanobrevibacter sp.]|jgi:polyphosphate glucokinase|nr:ROK family protein [Candidatus Methanoflexus mossambicus]